MANTSHTLLRPPSRPLVLSTGGDAQSPTRLLLREAKTTIGSGEGCTLRLAHTGVDPMHCLILRGSRQTVVRRRSKATRLNGQPFDDAVLNPGDVLDIGSVQFTVTDALPEPSGNDAHGSPYDALCALDEWLSTESEVDVPTPTSAPVSEPQPAADLRAREARALSHGRVRRLIGELRKGRQQHTDFNAKLDELDQSVTRRDETIEQLQSTLHENADADQQRQQALRDSTDELDRLHGQLAEQDGAHKVAQTELIAARKALAQTIARQQQDTEQYEAESARQTQQLNDAAAQLDRERGEWHQQQLQLEQQLAEHRAANEAEANAQHEDDFRKLEEARRELAQTIVQRQQDTEQYEAESARQTQQLNDAAAQLDRERDEWRRQQQQHEQQLAEHRTANEVEANAQHEDDFRQLEEARQELTRERHELDETLAELSQQRDAWTTQQGAFDAERSQFNTQRDSLATDKEELASLRETLDTRQQELEAGWISLQTEQNQLTEERRDLETHVAGAASLDEQHNLVTAAQAELETDRRAVEADRCRLAEEREELDTIRIALEASETSRAAKTSEQESATESTPIEETQAHRAPSFTSQEQETPVPSDAPASSDASAPSDDATRNDNLDLLARLREASFVEDQEEAPPSDIAPSPVERIAPIPSPATAGLGLDDEDDDEALEDYMAKLMDRVRGTSHDTAVVEPHTDFVDEEDAPKTSLDAAATKTEDRSEEADTSASAPGHSTRRRTALERQADMAAMRELAHQSSKNALDRHLLNRWKGLAISKTGLAIGAFLCSCALLAMAPDQNSAAFFGGVAGLVIATHWLVQSARYMHHVHVVREHDTESEQISDDETPPVEATE